MGRNWAIVVGINTYDNLLPLKYAQLDAEAMATWFKEAKFDQVFVFTENSPSISQVATYSVSSPIPTQPTYARFQRALDVLFENPLLKPEDNFWFFFAGHGKRYANKDYLMFLDSNPQAVDRTAISVNDVTEKLLCSGAGNVVLFLDACRDEPSRSGDGIGGKYQGVITFYSCKPNQKAYEIEELQHGAFTYSLLEGLRLQGEANCATVERLAQHLTYQVPAVNSRYGKAVQNPDLQADSPYKLYFILLEQTATLRDVEPLKYQASQAENRGDLSLAKQLWVRVLAVSRGDWDAIEAIERIALRQQGSFEPTVTTSEVTSPSGGSSESNELLAQKQEEHRQNLVRYRQAFSEVIEQEYPINQASRNKLQQLQKSLRLKKEEVLRIEQPIIVPKEAEYCQRQEQERIRKQQEAEQQFKRESQRLKQQQQLEKWRQLFTTITTPTLITRKKFLWWAVGSVGFVTAVVEREIFKGQTPISVAKPKYLLSKQKVFGLPLWMVEFETVTVNKNGGVIKRNSNKQAKLFKEDLGNNVTLEMVAIPSGKFLMGSPDSEGLDSEKPQHQVTVKSFFMGKHPITQAQWRRVAALPKVNHNLKADPSNFKGDNRPVERVSWYDAVEFCSRLSKYTNKEYRLPSEAEWEYACRAGTTTPFHFGETMTTELANYNGNYTYASEPKGKNRQKTIEVGSFPPNGFGLYDMHGNVWEWCQDDWHDSYQGAPTDGSAWLNGNDSSAVLRGASWVNIPKDCCSAYRVLNYREDHEYFNGFRVVCAVERILQ
ncbi:hypothetical protein NIES37_40270 [Tolypothrix tenuis PCC 7101]|uniref:Uncharacterized protein n=1 Tax=Tolypothrix tenuis PCC 7101 TaxID=231146 RepID=A0A1Z4N2T2_9CYAN|nr:SUMF1/EgtB/PvdO family nonheme iron enzyme [Aulosira sp. FACHB-113]BAZ00044.1 hypothetical protein NIES37_40270 [Tolypothrix tenuis PCC 7101]BAZ76035.1 hypothetical protein NIES50_46320 [Aulosira laxa NIES-50]